MSETLLKYLRSISLFAVLLFSIALAQTAHAVDIDISDAATPDEAGVDQTIAIFLSSQPAAPITVSYTVVAGTATAGDDYTHAGSGTVTFGTSDTVKSIPITIVQDNLDEDTETVYINITGTTAGTIVDNQAVLYIVDDDPAPAISVADNASVESAGNAVISATLSHPSSKNVSVSWRAVAGSATDGADFTSAQGVLNFAPGDLSKDITISLLDDSSDEDNETVVVSLLSPVFATLDNASAVLTISDDDPEPSLSAADVTTADENNASLVISLSAPSSRTVAVLATSAGISATESFDYNAFSTTVQIPPGETSATLNIPLNNDTLDEDAETFEVQLSNASSAIIADNNSIITITDDDDAPDMTLVGTTIADDNGTATAYVQLSRASGKTITVNYATSGGTATAGADYVADNGSLTFTPNQTSKPIAITIIGDSQDEYDETISIALSGATNVSSVDDSNVILITDNDPAPALSISDAASPNEAAAPASLSVSLSAPSQKIVTADYATSDGTATAGADYTAVTGQLTFTPGVVSQTISVPVLSDTVDEDSETVFVTLSNPASSTINDNQGELTIIDDDAPPNITVDDVSAPELGIAQQVTLRLDAASELTVTVDYATADSTAWQGDDYVSTSGTATFNPGDITAIITVPIIADEIDENDESFSVLLSNPVNGVIADNASVVTILDDDAPPLLRLEDNATDEGSASLTATVTLSRESALPVSVDYASVDGDALAGIDFTPVTGTLNFAPGETSKTVTVTLADDALDEIDEVFSFDLSNNVNAGLDSSQGRLTITDNDEPPALSIADNATIDESAVPASLTVSLDAPSGKDITVNYTTSDGTASAGSDYTAASGMLTFAAGVTSQTVSVDILSDITDEDNETLTVILSNPSAATLNDDTAVLTITDDDLPPALSISDLTTNNEASVNQTVTVTLSPASQKTVTVNYATADGIARAGADYTAASGMLTFGPGITTQQISVAIIDDMLDETDEGFQILLSNSVNASISDNASIIVITDDEGLPALTVQDVTTVNETAGNLSTTVSLSAASALGVTVNYTTIDSTALDGSDYTAVSGTLSFAAGETSKTVSIPILGDNIDENDEQFILEISGPANAVIGTAQAVMTITDDDAPPSLSVSDNTTADETSATASLAVSLSAVSGKDITVDYTTADGTASAGSDYTAASGRLTFPAGTLIQSVPVSVLHDIADEDNETVSVSLSNPSAATISDGTGILTITDDDLPPAISIDDVTTNSEAAVNQSVTLRLSAPSQQTVTVDWTTADASAVAGADYSMRASTVTFAAGETVKTIDVPILDDGLVEDDESFTIDLSNAVNAAIADNQAVVTITDDEGLPALNVQNIVSADENGAVSLTVSLSAPSALSVTVNYHTEDGTADNGSDYSGTFGTLTFAPSVTSQSVSVSLLQDLTDEDDETFDLVLSAPVNASVPSPRASVTITDDDAAPSLSISDNSTADETGTAANLTVSLSAVSQKTVAVSYTTSDGTASAGSDYTAASGTLSFAPGTLTQTINVAILADSEDETDETLTLTLSNAINASVADDSGVLTITDDDGAPALSIDDVTTNNETAISHDVTIRLNAPSQKQVSVNWATQDGSAVAGSDYSPRSGTAIFSPGAVAQTISVPVLDDNLVESTETFTILLSTASNAGIADNSSLFTITDDDSLSLSIADATTADESAALQSLTVTLANPSSTAVSVDYATADASAAAGSDYTAVSGTLTFNAGVTQQTISVGILADTQQEGTETFEVNLSNPTGGATVADSQAIVTITDDDGDPALSVADVSVSETDGSASATVSLSYASSLPISVDYATADASATAGSDYSAVSGSLSFAAGETSKTVTIAILTDSEYEGNESFTLTLSSPDNASLGDASGVITILEDDNPLSDTETQTLKQNLILGKNSISRAETSFMNRILLRNRNMLFSEAAGDTRPRLSFHSLSADWNDRTENLDAVFSIDDLTSNRRNNTSWETAISHSKNDSGVKNTTVSTALNFSHRISDQTLFGYILGFGYADTAMSGAVTGSNLGRSGSVGLYASYKIQDTLILDLMASKTFEQNEMNSEIGGKTVRGEYDRNSTSYSASLQGIYKLSPISELRPTFSYTMGKSAFKNAYFNITQGSLTSAQQIDFGTDDYYSLSFEPEFKTVLGNRTNLIRPAGFNMLKLRPKYFCEKYNSETTKSCGRGLGITLANHHPIYNYNQDLVLDYEKISRTTTYSLRYKRIY